MLLRSSSPPIFNSWLPYCKDPSPKPLVHLSVTRSASLSTSPFHSPIDDQDLKIPPVPEAKTNKPIKASHGYEESEEEHAELETISSSRPDTLQRLLSSSGLGEKSMHDDGCCCGTPMRKKESHEFQTSGGSGTGSNVEWDFSKSTDGVDDAYYRRMIEAIPADALFLCNMYARLLKEIQGDNAKAEEYYGRPALEGRTSESESDGVVLCRLAYLIWTAFGDAERAETYFQRALNLCENDCHVAAAYAWFLWDVDE